MGQKIQNFKAWFKVFRWTFNGDYETYWKYNKRRFVSIMAGVMTVLLIFLMIVLFQHYKIGIFALGG